MATSSQPKIFRLEKATLVAGPWIIGLGLVIGGGFGIAAVAQAFGYLSGQQDLLIGASFGALFALIGFWVRLCVKNQKIELFPERLVIFDSYNLRELDVTWSEIQVYERTHVKSWIIHLPRPHWQITVGQRKVWVPFVEDYVEFQRQMLHHIPHTAIPTKYYNHEPQPNVRLDVPIRQFSLQVDNDGLSIHSAVAKASIRWGEILYVEEIDYKVASDDDDPRVPRVYVLSETDAFELTRAWDKYDDIRDFIFAKAPKDALVVR